ncbi:hypothetical protein [Streptosporangium sp. CA-115845]|uniref:hypothetical protein n=1 Tax=Streptosporangium sp. CA-115845 TaxID=3240071 RepID=UPI003D8C120F
MKLLDTLPKNLTDRLYVNSAYVVIVEQAKRLHENVPFGVVVGFVTDALEKAEAAPRATEWQVECVREASRLLRLSPEELEKLV